MVLHGVDVEQLLEGHLADFLGHFLVLNEEAVLLGIEYEVPLVVEGEGKELDFFSHLE